MLFVLTVLNSLIYPYLHLSIMSLIQTPAACLAASQTCIGMNLPELVQPVLVCFEDPDPRVRYYACESLYNISKIARGAVLIFFNTIFDGLCKVDNASCIRVGSL